MENYKKMIKKMNLNELVKAYQELLDEIDQDEE
jgi:hypothetical protein